MACVKEANIVKFPRSLANPDVNAPMLSGRKARVLGMYKWGRRD
jgi:hypothetical protein